ncbi:protein ZBED8-like [Daktulosphaira vitifoliae]|uniref:protein ZBED8-like n=1 Tax=Daktulosphaira vitifoliae TaxID=58002 RepID=UPI0021A9C8D6|nr:protein ZBED8-like [Daktulosphaira vitifoliae]
MLVKSMSGQEKSVEAALRVCWTLNKHQKVTALFEEKKDIINAIQSIPLSARSNTRRNEILADDNKNSLISILQKAPCYALALDESCDIIDSEQISIFVRFFDVESRVFRDELLALLPLKYKTRGEDLFKTFDNFMNKSNISYDKIVSVSTDGAPAMVGKEKGFVKRIKDKNPEILSYQCIIHQTSLCGKLSTTLKEVMDVMIKIINFMRSRSSLQNRQFKQFLSECDSAYTDLLQHNNVRWLSKSKLIERFWNIKVEVITFLEKLDSEESKQYHKFLTNKNCTVFLSFLSDLSKEVSKRFKDFAKIRKLSQFLKNPFEVSPIGEWIDIATSNRNY